MSRFLDGLSSFLPIGPAPEGVAELPKSSATYLYDGEDYTTVGDWPEADGGLSMTRLPTGTATYPVPSALSALYSQSTNVAHAFPASATQNRSHTTFALLLQNYDASTGATYRTLVYASNGLTTTQSRILLEANSENIRVGGRILDSDSFAVSSASPVTWTEGGLDLVILDVEWTTRTATVRVAGTEIVAFSGLGSVGSATSNTASLYTGCMRAPSVTSVNTARVRGFWIWPDGLDDIPGFESLVEAGSFI